MENDTFGDPFWRNYGWCPVCLRSVTNPHYCPGPQPNIYTWPKVETTGTKPNPLQEVIVTFDPVKELPGTVIFMDGVYYIKLDLDAEDFEGRYDWYSDEGMALNATIMNARHDNAKTFEFLKRPRTSRRAVLERFLNHKDIDQALKELKSTIDTEGN